jgi:hypothetical protein
MPDFIIRYFSGKSDNQYPHSFRVFFENEQAGLINITFPPFPDLPGAAWRLSRFLEKKSKIQFPGVYLNRGEVLANKGSRRDAFAKNFVP